MKQMSAKFAEMLKAQIGGTIQAFGEKAVDGYPASIPPFQIQSTPILTAPRVRRGHREKMSKSLILCVKCKYFLPQDSACHRLVPRMSPTTGKSAWPVVDPKIHGCAEGWPIPQREREVCHDR